MGQFSVEKPVLPGSTLSGNPQSAFNGNFAVPLRGSTDPISRLVMVRLASGERMETRDESPHPIFRANLLHGR
jgi:hypothetical protein